MQPSTGSVADANQDSSTQCCGCSCCRPLCYTWPLMRWFSNLIAMGFWPSRFTVMRHSWRSLSLAHCCTWSWLEKSNKVSTWSGIWPKIRRSSRSPTLPCSSQQCRWWGDCSLRLSIYWCCVRGTMRFTVWSTLCPSSSWLTSMIFIVMPCPTSHWKMSWSTHYTCTKTTPSIYATSLVLRSCSQCSRRLWGGSTH